MSDFCQCTPVTSDTALPNTVSDAIFFHRAYPTLWAAFQRTLIASLDLTVESVKISSIAPPPWETTGT